MTFEEWRIAALRGNWASDKGLRALFEKGFTPDQAFAHMDMFDLFRTAAPPERSLGRPKVGYTIARVQRLMASACVAALDKLVHKQFASDADRQWFEQTRAQMTEASKVKV